MRSARIVKPNEALEVQELETPKAKGSQVLIKVQSSGVCHSDIHLWEGGYEGIEGQFLKTTEKKHRDLLKMRRFLFIHG
jgi:propanol-preferring alcohol dehydrogenase